MQICKFDSDKYIYLKVNKNIYDEDNYPVYIQGQILRFLRSELESYVYSRLMGQGFSSRITSTRKENLDDSEILPNDIYSDITVKEDGVAKLCLWPGETYCLSKWVMDHLMDRELEFRLFDGPYYRDERNKEELEKYSEQVGVTSEGYPVIKVLYHNLHLEFKLKEGEKLDFTDPGVISFLLDPKFVELIKHSHAIKGGLKEKLFEREFKNIFEAPYDIYYSFSDDDHYYIYYKLNEDTQYKESWQLPCNHAKIYSKREDGYADIVFLEYSEYDDPVRYEISNLRKIGTEIPKEEAIKINNKRLEEDKIARQQQHDEYIRQKTLEEEELEKLFEEHANDEKMFPGINGNFAHTSTYDDNKLSSLEEVQEFFKKLSEIDKEALDSMYFYGGTIPYILSGASEARKFGDVDIFVPIEKMSLVRQALDRVGLIRSYDSIELTQEHNFTSRIKLSEEEESKLGLKLLASMLVNDETEVNNNLQVGRVYQDFGLKGSLFGINISIFPIYQYKNDLMAKSFKVSDVMDYLLIVNVLNDCSMDEVAKNVTIYGNNINILPIEYTIISKEGAIDDGYIKRTDKDYQDLEFIKEHKEELGIDEELILKLRDSYPDFSIALAYFIYDNCIEKVSGHRYKELILKHGGQYLT